MKPAVDEYDVRRGIILCNAIKELSTVDGGIPKPQSMPHVWIRFSTLAKD